MLDLVITACLLAAPDSCQTMTMPADGPPTACIMAAPATVAQWQQQHPKWRVVRLTCMPHQVKA